MRSDTSRSADHAKSRSVFFRLLLSLSAALILAHGMSASAQSSSVLQVSQVAAGGETRIASTALQPTSAFSLEAWVTASATHTNYPAFISYGLDTASPYEAYVLQAPLINGTKPPEV